ncbi:hypothetical protein GGR54DRAFT_195268 [Hypoxylon sp. NC1633]|nr:hypothetical protein GGR54DRAFT_195268 [Hypoxylon sp. NC1633]
MTKQWAMYEATIKSLYAENTLSVVRQIMIDKYGFRASTRAYRGRLIRWNVRKYNCRKRGDRAASMSASSSGGGGNDGCSSTTSDPDSPVTMVPGDLASPVAAHQHQHQMKIEMGSGMGIGVGRSLGHGHGHLAMPEPLSHLQHQQEYGPVGGQAHGYVNDSHNNNNNNNDNNDNNDTKNNILSISNMNSNCNNNDATSSSYGSHSHADMVAPQQYYGGYSHNHNHGHMGEPYATASNATTAAPTGAGYEVQRGGLGYYASPPQSRQRDAAGRVAELPYAAAGREYGHDG